MFIIHSVVKDLHSYVNMKINKECLFVFLEFTDRSVIKREKERGV